MGLTSATSTPTGVVRIAASMRTACRGEAVATAATISHGHAAISIRLGFLSSAGEGRLARARRTKADPHPRFALRLGVSFTPMANPTVRFPIDRMVETRPRIDAWRFRKSPPEGCRPGPDKIDLELGGHRLGLVWERSLPWILLPWFVCPSCQRRVRYLHEVRCLHEHEPELWCRRCAQLDWASRHGSARAQPLAWKVRSLRRKLGGVDEHLFGILPEIPAHHTRRRRLVKAIIEAEDKLLREGYARTVALMRRAIGAGWRPGKPTSRKARSKPKTEHYKQVTVQPKTGH
jgi:hypothetical protein